MIWSVEDIEYLHNYAGFQNHKQLSKKLGRSIDAIKQYQARHGIRFLDNVYTYTLLARELGCTRAILRRYHNRGWLKGKRATWKCIYGNRPMLFTEEAVVRFLKKYPQALANRVFPNLFFRGVRNG